MQESLFSIIFPREARAFTCAQTEANADVFLTESVSVRTREEAILGGDCRDSGLLDHPFVSLNL